MPNDHRAAQAWHLFTRLGEAQILLPALLLLGLALLRRPAGRPLALWWAGALSAAALLTTVTKLAFIGWGIGWPALDFTGISGHAMFAAATYPLLLGVLAPARWRWPAVAAGAVLATLLGASRVVVDAHSVSESIAGVLVGGAASAVALARAGLPSAGLSLAPAAAAALWFAFTPAVHRLPTRMRWSRGWHWRCPATSSPIGAASGGHRPLPHHSLHHSLHQSPHHSGRPSVRPSVLHPDCRQHLRCGDRPLAAETVQREVDHRRDHHSVLLSVRLSVHHPGCRQRLRCGDRPLAAETV